jgi:hypothetical protein
MPLDLVKHREKFTLKMGVYFDNCGYCLLKVIGIGFVAYTSTLTLPRKQISAGVKSYDRDGQ